MLFHSAGKSQFYLTQLLFLDFVSSLSLSLCLYLYLSPEGGVAGIIGNTINEQLRCISLGTSLDYVLRRGLFFFKVELLGQWV